MSWSEHLWYITKKISSICGVLNSMKNLAPKYVLKSIYHSLIGSHLNYGLLLWGAKRNQLATLQKKAIRIISKSSFLAHTEPIYKRENILKINDLYKSKCLDIFFKYKNDLLPPRIKTLFQDSTPSAHRYPTSNQSRLCVLTLAEKSAISEKTKNLLSYNLPKIINAMPTIVLDKALTHSFPSYQQYNKKFFIDNYSAEECVDSNCYSCNPPSNIPPVVHQ